MEADFVKLEEQILKRWKEERAFEKSLQRRTPRGARGKKAKRFVFYEGPPTANGSPGIHHVLSRSFKDVVCRYKTMRGFFVPRQAGWDTHGLPVELQIEKKLGLRSKKDIEKYGIAKFNKACKQSVWEYKQEWDNLTERIGFWLDTDNPYITYSKEYMEKLWGVMKQFWQKGLLYKDYKVVPYCPRCGTPESSHELAQGYKTVKDRSVFVKFKLEPGQKIGTTETAGDNTYIVSWTTTPWTLPGNVALALGEEVEYEMWEQNGERLIVAAERREDIGMKGKRVVAGVWQGKSLAGLKYEQLFDISELRNDQSHRTYTADFVNTDEGTGIVHTAVMYGEDDYQLGAKLGLPKKHTVNEEGKFNELVPQWKGVFVKDAEPAIIEDLKKRNLLYKEELYEHEYPFCWRCSTPLLYYAKDSWFVNMQKVKKQLLANNQSVNWIPPHLKTGRMGEWLTEVKDWAFSRERYWGTPLPVWECDSCSHRAVIGSVEELKKQTTPRNTYYVLRHGHSDRQKTNTLSSQVADKVALTAKGKKEIAAVAKKLKAKKIDMIFSSDLLRTRQTAEIAAKELGIVPAYDKRLREVDVGKLNGKKVEDIKTLWGREGETEMQHFLRRFVDPLPGGESWVDVQRRVVGLLQDLEQRHQSKRILLIGHETPFTMLEASMKGLSREEIVRFRQKNMIQTGEVRNIQYANLPFNDDMELDLHRPYIDEIAFGCEQCGKGLPAGRQGTMKRVKDVVDVWFDSGSMPFASGVEGYPADYITEAIDQTRGWFYTLLAVATLLGKRAPYKNAISLGHVLDAKGEKMSKSKGNIVSPWDMIEKYGVDTLRWYFYTLNHPWDSKAFIERDLQQVMRKFLLLLWNSFAFYQTYKIKSKTQSPKSKNILDMWIVSRLNGKIKNMTVEFDEFKITEAARRLEQFVVEDLSLWYIRRSRQRFQNPASRRDLQDASATLGYVLGEVSKLAAPFTPFVAEHIYGEVGGKGSVHWQDWPKADSKKISKKLENEMEAVLEIVSKGLAERAKAGIRVRQPLASLKFSIFNFQFSKDVIDLIKDEVNVKEVVFDKNLKTDVELDTEITPALQREGTLRELLRHIQEMRKQAGYKPRDRVRLRYFGAEELKDILKEHQEIIMRQVGLEEMLEAGRPKQAFDVEQEFSLDGQTLWLGIRKL